MSDTDDRGKFGHNFHATHNEICARPGKCAITFGFFAFTLCLTYLAHKRHQYNMLLQEDEKNRTHDKKAKWELWKVTNKIEIRRIHFCVMLRIVTVFSACIFVWTCIDYNFTFSFTKALNKKSVTPYWIFFVVGNHI